MSGEAAALVAGLASSVSPCILASVPLLVGYGAYLAAG